MAPSVTGLTFCCTVMYSTILKVFSGWSGNSFGVFTVLQIILMQNVKVHINIKFLNINLQYLTWASPVISKGFKRTLQLHDFDKISPYESVEVNFKRITRLWNDEVNKRDLKMPACTE